MERWPVTDPRYRLGLAPPNKGKRYPVEVLDRDELHRLLAACSHRAPTGVRNRALIVVMWRGGLRVAEACALFPRDVDPGAGTVNVRRGKGAKQRIVGLDAEAMAVVQRWLDMRARLKLNGRHPLFCVVRRGPTFGRQLHPARVRELLALRAEKASIDKRVHPHGLRHTHASELSLEGVPIEVIRRQLGHADLSTTQRYINHIAPLDIVRAMQARSWSPNGHDDHLEPS
jgi:integrase/recombinase XerD